MARYVLKSLRRRLDPLAIGGFLCLGVAWQCTAAFPSGDYLVSSPAHAFGRLLEWARDGFLWPHIAATAENTGLGFGLAVIVALAAAVILCAEPILQKIVEPLAFISFAMPKVIFAPMLILWIGVGRPSVVVMSFLSSFFVIFFNVLSGIDSVPRAYVDTAVLLGAGRWATAFKFQLPAAAPFIFSSLSQGLIYAFHGCVLGEMTSSNLGLGYVILYFVSSADSTGVVAALIVVGLLSYLLIILMNAVARRAAAPLINSENLAW
jgi:NitT/TauT family transport system permease protein